MSHHVADTLVADTLVVAAETLVVAVADTPVLGNMDILGSLFDC